MTFYLPWVYIDGACKRPRKVGDGDQGQDEMPLVHNCCPIYRRHRSRRTADGVCASPAKAGAMNPPVDVNVPGCQQPHDGS